MKEAQSVEEKLIASFKELVMKEPVERITIKEITDGAGVIRTTFYYHFQDKYELIERIIVQELLNPGIISMVEQDPEEGLLFIFTKLDAERPFYRRLARMEGQNSFEELLKQYIGRALEDFIHRSGSDEKISRMTERYPWLTMKFVTDYYAQELTYAVIIFLKTDPPATPADATEVIEYELVHSPGETIREWFLK